MPQMKTPPGSKTGKTPDLTRRLQIARQFTARRQASTPPPGEAPPGNAILAKLPREISLFLRQPASRLSESAVRIVQAAGQFDLPRITDEVRPLLNVPQAAVSTFVAASQAHAIESLNGAAGQFPAPPEELRLWINRHHEMRGGGQGLRRYLLGVAVGKVLVLAARAMAQDHAKAWIKAQMAALPQDSPDYIHYQAALAPIEAIEARMAAQAGKKEAKEERATERAVAALEETEADFLVAKAFSEIREDRMPNFEVLLKAARQYKKRLIEKGLLDETEPKKAPAPEKKAEGKTPRPRKPRVKNDGRVLH